ncbi:Membrane protease YdiL, CAAX protease family [Halogranum rubrum]|uniref:Membrane protease YdiL, CAAX protease family n=1 Tax=Halogranum rubrum TaxID=553466 RepID=A0A1I4GTS1_9EURY|nr:type II CAAX endopeptidase family protein [Halogranum rubrum]SFL32863.1 Membrane protease YdiL, CAAX protease family [Halogranum rubrum]
MSSNGASEESQGSADGPHDSDYASLDPSSAEWRFELSLTYPVYFAIALLLVVSFVQFVDVFVLQLSAVPFPLIASRVLGIFVVLGYLWLLGQPLRAIGLHSKNVTWSFVIGGLPFMVLFLVGYGLQFTLLVVGETSPQLLFGAIDPMTGSTASTLFTVVYVGGTFLNSFLEEGLFRGVLLTHFMHRLSFWRANALQAMLFGLWHLVFPLHGLVTGQLTTSAAIDQAVQLLFLTTSAGFVFGYLFFQTNSLWTPWLAHTLDNLILNVFHIKTAGGLNGDMNIVMLASMLGFPLVFVVAWALGNRYEIPRLRSWGANRSFD